MIRITVDKRLQSELRDLTDAAQLCDEQGKVVAIATRTNGDTQRLFQDLLSRWKTERGATSSVVKMAMHPAYQQIIGMGVMAIPFLLKELKERPDHLFWALHAITHADPVPPVSRGRIREMAAAWVQWGRDHGYVVE
jgi:hypothetical protein